MAQDAFSIEFVPPVRVGENLELRKNATDIYGYGTVKYIEQLPEKIHDFGAITAGSTTSDQEITDLYMPDGELAAYQLVPLDDEEITVSQPKSQKRFAGKSYVHIITPFSSQVNPSGNQRRIFVWEDEKVYFDVKEPTRYNRQRHRVLYHGWRIILGTLTQTKPPQVTVVPVEGD